VSRRWRVALAGVWCLPLLAIAPVASGAGAEAITVVERQIDVNPGETNPCTGATGTIIDDEQDVFHITAIADGTLTLTGHSTVNITFTPDDPGQIAYRGRETFALSETTTSRLFVTTSTSRVRLKGTDGTILAIRAVAHLTVSPSGVTAVFDRPTFACS
jgi:hypothetical protein